MRALIFDFDGLILDTEMPDYQAWVELYGEYDCELPLEIWATIVGGGAASSFNPFDYLAELLGREIDREAVRARQNKRSLSLIAQQPILPGVMDYLNDAKRMEMKLAIASSSPHYWVDPKLERLEITGYFDVILCADDVTLTKPDPELYLSALAALDVPAEEAIVLEDSPNGVLAARRAGIFCVAVPNPMTRQFTFDQTDLMLDSLADMTLEEVIAKAQG